MWFGIFKVLFMCEMVNPQLLMFLCGEATKIQKHSIFYFLKYLREFHFCSVPLVGSGNLILDDLGFLPPTSSWLSKFKEAGTCLRPGGKGMMCAGPSPISSSACCLIWLLSITLFISGICRDLPVLIGFVGMVSILASAAVFSPSLSQGHLGPAGSVHQTAFSSYWGHEECPTAVLRQPEIIRIWGELAEALLIETGHEGRQRWLLSCQGRALGHTCRPPDAIWQVRHRALLPSAPSNPPDFYSFYALLSLVGIEHGICFKDIHQYLQDHLVWLPTFLSSLWRLQKRSAALPTPWFSSSETFNL